jgi:hypothetical protein
MASSTRPLPACLQITACQRNPTRDVTHLSSNLIYIKQTAESRLIKPIFTETPIFLIEMKADFSSGLP